MSQSSIPAIPAGVRLVNFENGLTLILREDHSAPVVSVQAWARTGSIHEGRWLGAGLSHVLEHMLFKGTATRGPGQIDREVHDAGGYMNAYTSFDRTVYHIDVPNTGARVAVDILADIMQRATLPADELVKELDVIRREMDMGQDDPHQRSSRRLFETAYTHSNYRYTIIGYRDIFDTLKRDDIQLYYHERYAANNQFFVVAGDFDAAAVEAQLREAYEGNKARPLPPVFLPDEPRQIAPREVIEETTVELGHLHFAWHVPPLRDADVPVLDVLSTLLGTGRSSRLFREVRERQGLVTHADAWMYSPGNAGMVGASAVFEAHRFDAVRAAILTEFERMRNDLVSEAELAKAVRMFTSATLSSRKTMSGQAQDLGGNWSAIGDLNFSARYLAAVKRVTADDIQRVARRHLTVENRTLYALLPTGSRPVTVSVAQTAVASPVQKFTLSNGLTLLVKEDHRLPFVEFRAVLRGGVLAETASDSGASLLAAKLLLQGTRTRSAEQIASEVESLGGSLDTYGGANSWGVSAEVLSEDFSAGLGLVADVLLEPLFPDDAFEREREIQLSNIAAQRDQLVASCSRLMRQRLFGAVAYGLDANGTTESVAALSLSTVRAVHSRLASPRNCVLAIFGDVDTAAVRQAVEQQFGRWHAEFTLPAPVDPPPLTGIERVDERRDKKQAVIMIGFRGTELQQPDRYALELIQESCSDLGSRLFTRIRDKLGLAYYVGATHQPGLIPGTFAFYAGTDPGKVAVVEREMLAEVASLRAEGLSEAELRRAKAKVIGQRKIERQNLGGHALGAALDELFGLGFEHSDTDDGRYEAVTSEEICAAARRYLTPDRMVVATIQPEE